MDSLLNKILATLPRGDGKDALWPDSSGEYWGMCPYCITPEVGESSVSERGFHCFGCDARASLRQLAAKLNIAIENQPVLGCTLQAYADAKHLPIAFLREQGLADTTYRNAAAIKIPYLGLEKQHLAVRYRTALYKGEKDERFFWQRGTKAKGLLYGLWHMDEIRKAGWCLLVEGESDCHTAWLHHIPALGVPGASNWEASAIEYLAGLQVFVWREPDMGGDVLVSSLRPGMPEAMVVSPMNGAKDISEVYLHGQDVTAYLEQVKRRAVSMLNVTVDEDSLHFTDTGNAMRFASQHKDRVHYCYPWGRWLIWDSKRWAQDQTGEIMRLAKETIRSLYAEGSAIIEKERRDKLVKHALHSEAQSRIEAMLTLAQSEPGIALMPDAFDAQPWLLNCNNGTVDLRTGELRPHSPDDMLTALCSVDYDPNATCPRWYEFQMQICNEDVDFLLHKQRAYGYALTGNTSEQCLFLLYGTGANGKSTELGAVRSVLGDDYALHTPTETLLVNERGGGVPNDVARLRGARYVTAVEAESGRRLAEGLIKQMTGGDPIAARFMRAEWFEFMPTHKLFLAVNHKPIIRGQDKGIWRRIRLWPYTTTIPDDKQDKELAAKLEAEAAGILAWMVEGCLDWQKYGLGKPAQVVDATADYQQEMDVLGGFVQDTCIETPLATVTTKDLYAAYSSWCEKNGEKAMTKTALGLRLQERGAISTRDMHARGWRGIGLLAQNPAVQVPMEQEIKF